MATYITILYHSMNIMMVICHFKLYFSQTINSFIYSAIQHTNAFGQYKHIYINMIWRNKQCKYKIVCSLLIYKEKGHFNIINVETGCNL